MKAKITIRDIANLANVSVSTVSRVISNSAGVDPKKITKVHEAIEMTGYQPNYTARALATKSTNTIGVIIDTTPKLSLSNSYFIEVLEAIASELSVNDKDMLLIFANDFSNSDEYSKIRRLINSKKLMPL